MHVRKPKTPCSQFTFKFGKKKINYCNQYKYLGLIIDQFVNFEKMSNSSFDPAKRALNSVICKMIKNKGFPFDIFHMLYNACVTTVKDYAHEVIGFHEYSGSTKLHNNALRSYLGVGNSANLCGIRSEMAILEPRSRTQIKMLRFYLRMKNMSDERLTKKIFLYDQMLSLENENFSCWTNEIKQIVSRNNMLFVIDSYSPKQVVNILEDSLYKKDIEMFRNQCRQSPKLRTYVKLFSPFTEHKYTINYTRMCLPFIMRKRIAQIRLGVLPIRIETDRYLKDRTPAELRYCLQPNCHNTLYSNNNNLKIEDEIHYICQCNEYQYLRDELYSRIDMTGFYNFSDEEKFRYLLTSKNTIKMVGHFIIDTFDKRQIK